KDARSAAWSALENGTLEASAIGPDRAPTLIGKHEWQYLIGRTMPAYIEGRKRQDALYVISTFTPSIGGVPAGNPRFTNVTVPRAAILATWPPRSLTVSASPGRPSIMNEIEAELDRWIKGGFPVLSSEMKKHNQGSRKTLIAISRALEIWAVK